MTAKQQQFLTEVVAAITIIHATGKGKGGVFHALIEMDDAHWAADRIPPDKSAHQAACEYVEFCLKGWTPETESTYAWFKRG